MSKWLNEYLKEIGLDNSSPEFLRSWARRVLMAHSGHSEDAKRAANEIWISHP